MDSIKNLSISIASVIIGFLIAVPISTNTVDYSGVGLIVWLLGLIFIIQWVVYIPSVIYKTEHYYDLTGSLTYILTVILALLYGTSSLADPFDSRSLLVAALVVIWALRLGTFLFMRVRTVGKDGRFDELKVNPTRYLITWTVQGLWVFMTLLAALVVMTTTRPEPLGMYAVVGGVIWLLGFLLESIADWQKWKFKQQNPKGFITTGLWKFSRHPNYLGEITLWTGMLVIAIPVLQGWQWLAVLSPVFIVFLLTKISGIPLLEARGQERWGHLQTYQKYIAETPVLIPGLKAMKTSLSE